MAINFPSSPSVGDTFVVGTKVYTWDGTRWTFDFRNIVTGTTAERPTVTKPFVYYNTTLRVYEVWRPEYSVWEAVLTYPIQETTIDPTVAYSEATYTTPGTYQWECPDGVAYVHVVCVGGGGGAMYSSTAVGAYFSSGGGGGLGWKNNIAVTPGELYTVQVGAGGLSFYNTSSDLSTNSGENSYFIDSNTVAGFGASGNTRSGWKFGGGYVGDGGGNGGDSAPFVGSSYLPGAGGAGGYSGNGGTGGYYNGAVGVLATAGSGGGGGGGGYGDYASPDWSGSGGGVGILGQGTSGAAGASSAAGQGSPGGGGSGATTLSYGDLTGGTYGGGASTVVNSPVLQHGGGGAVRIIWGAGRAFPSTNTGVI